MSNDQPRYSHRGPDDARYYTHPVSEDMYPSVTSILKQYAKPALPTWAAKKVADAAIDDAREWFPMAREDREEARRWLKQAPWRSLNDSAGTGTAVHKVVECKTLGVEPPEVTDPDVAKRVAQFDRFCEQFRPKFIMSEATVFNHTYGYAGQLDLIVELDHPRLTGRFVVDVKSSASGPYKEWALQTAAYRHAEEVVLPSGEVVPMPETDGAFSLQLLPRSYRVHPLKTEDWVLRTFLYLREIWMFEHNHMGAVLGGQIGPWFPPADAQ